MTKDLRNEQRRLKSLYARARVAIFRELTKTKISDYKESEVYKSQRQIEAIIQMLNRQDERWTRRALPKAYKDQRATTLAQVEILGFKRKAKLNRAGLKYEMGRTMAFLRRANLSMKRTTDNFFGALRFGGAQLAKIQEFDDEEHAAFIEKTKALSLIAIREGWSRVKLSNLIAAKLYDLAEDGDFIIINGRNFNIESYAEMVARTEIRKAQTQAAKDTCAEYGCDLVQWSSHSNPCQECAPLEDQVFSLSGQDIEFPPLTADEEPPLHPNCGHSILATSREAMEARR